MSARISVFILTYNSERFIEKVLQSVHSFDNIVIVDSGSTDETLNLVASYNCRIFHQPWLGYSKQKQWALQHCVHDWVLNVDSDEIVSPALATEIKEVVTNHHYDALSIPIAEFFLGKASHGSVKKQRKVRCFRKSLGHYGEELVHEGVLINSTKIYKARHVIEHYGEYSVHVKVDKNNHYSSLRAQQSPHKKTSLFKLVSIFPLTFLKSYVLRRSCLDGRRGFISSMINAFYAFLKEAKYYENTKK